MVKRRLTGQQLARQQKNQADRIKRSQISDISNSDNLGPEQPGLLIAHHGLHVIVESSQKTLHHCKIRQGLENLVTGDHIIWQEAPDKSGIVVALLPRKNILARPSGTSKHHSAMKPIAANIDLLIIVIAVKPALSATTLDAYLVIAQKLGITPLIVINKYDLLDNTSEAVQSFVDRLKVYQSLGYDYVYTSTITHDNQTETNLSDLQKILRDKTSILMGQSGVGKSSLIQSLHPEADAKVGELCPITELGKHTTTGSRFYHLPTGGALIDSPGIRRFGLWHLSEKDLAEGFIEFLPFLGHCQFRNCCHQNELGCAILKARDQGLIHPLRIQNFHELINKHGTNL